MFRVDGDAWIIDVVLQHRLPKRSAMLSIGVRNLTDEEIPLVDSDPLNPRVVTRRLVTGSVSVVF